MTTRTRRYLFAAYSDIEQLDFEHLEKVCDRLFILIDEHTEHIPFPLVRHLQRLGKGVKWIPISDADGINLSVQLAFLMGKLHQKLPSDIDFAILSDDEDFDGLVQFIASKDRRCFRVRAGRTQETLTPLEKKPQAPPTLSPATVAPMPPTPLAVAIPNVLTQPSKANSLPPIGEDLDNTMIRFAPAEPVTDEPTVRNTAHDVIERLLRSGNRPAEVSTLKQYISLTNQQMVPGVVEKVVTFMAMNNNIQIRDKEVVYNF
jgi:hypothetical protein